MGANVALGVEVSAPKQEKVFGFLMAVVVLALGVIINGMIVQGGL